jgi:release factor glutamine methyltransferase
MVHPQLTGKTITEAPTVNSALEQAHRRLLPISESARLDAQVLVAHVCGRDRSWILAHPEAQLDVVQQQELETALGKLEANQPLPYVLGSWEFFGLRFNVTPDVLIPRPETEYVVEAAIEWLEDNPNRHRVVDVGTGSACIAISLAVHMPHLKIIATDISAAALQIARSNLDIHHANERVRLIQADLITTLRGPFDLICANLPYIPTSTLPSLDVYSREPAQALDGGVQGVEVIEQLVKQAEHRLAPGGLLVMEIDSSQAHAVNSLIKTSFPHSKSELIPDLAGHPRVWMVRN